MEIIAARTDPKKQITCPHCGAVIAFYETEEHTFIASNRFPVRLFKYIECPSCKLTIRTRAIEPAPAAKPEKKEGFFRRLLKYLTSPSPYGLGPR